MLKSVAVMVGIAVRNRAQVVADVDKSRWRDGDRSIAVLMFCVVTEICSLEILASVRAWRYPLVAEHDVPLSASHGLEPLARLLSAEQQSVVGDDGARRAAGLGFKRGTRRWTGERRLV